MKILVALPVYDGKLQSQSVTSLLTEAKLACMAGDELNVMFLPSCSQIAMGRNYFAKVFMDSDHDRLFFLDADVTFEPGALIKTARRPEDIVGGAYRLKLPNQEEYPVGWLPDPELRGLYANEAGLIEVAYVPGGFISISRNVFQKMKEAHAGREYTHQGVTTQCYWQMPYVDGGLWSEDSYFCKEWRDLGGKCFLDPSLTLTHWDFNVPYKGHIGSWLMGRNAQETA